MLRLLALLTLLMLLTACGGPSRVLPIHTLTPRSAPPQSAPEASPSATPGQTPTPFPSPTPIPPLPDQLDDPWIKIQKGERRLALMDGETVVAFFSIGLGFSPEGDKQREGDGRTPEGEYAVCTRNDHSNYYLSLGLNYPNVKDAQAGLERGDITQETYDALLDKLEAGRRPDWSTPLGGYIMIHGHGSHADWTAGCIAVEDAVMDILWKHCKLGVKVVITP